MVRLLCRIDAAVLRACVASLAVLAMQTGCAVTPTHPAYESVELPTLLPVRRFVANTDFTDAFSLSPDGGKLVWQGVSRLRPAILWRSTESRDARVAKRFRKGPPWPFWSADSRYILYHDDPSGRENLHVFAIDTRTPGDEARDLTPYENVRAFVQHVPRDHSSRIYVMHNRRDASVFDLYAIDIGTGEESLLFENSESVVSLLVDDAGAVLARVRQQDDARLLEVPDGDGWRTLSRAGLFDELYPVELTQDGNGLYVLSNVGRDKRVLSELDLDTGTETELFAHDVVDVTRVELSPDDNRPLMVYTEPGYPELHFLDRDFERRMTPLMEPGRNGLRIMSLDRSASKATLAIYDHTGADYRLVNLDTGRVDALGESPSRKFADVWVRPESVRIPASDGMSLHAYVTKPAGSDGVALPTVLLVHGGPWARDHWGHDDTVQFLVNRGYAVLQVNYRGSAGYGREYLFAAEGEFAGRMHRDLVDAVDWAIASGVSDADRVAIMGRSYGGYATLVGITMTPERFACGVDIVGVSDLASLLESAPPYWKPWMHMWTRFVGDPAKPTDRRVMDHKSPLNHAEQAMRPLLIIHGVNDPRVDVDQSERMVAALEAAGKEVDSLFIDDEGHGFGHWKNQLAIFRRVEDFLAACLGGRSSGFDYYQLGSWAF